MVKKGATILKSLVKNKFKHWVNGQLSFLMQVNTLTAVADRPTVASYVAMYVRDIPCTSAHPKAIAKTNAATLGSAWLGYS